MKTINGRKKITLYITIMIIIVTATYCNYCSTETCRRCCQVTPTGCINAMDFNIRVYYFLNKIIRDDMLLIIPFA